MICNATELFWSNPIFVAIGHSAIVVSIVEDQADEWTPNEQMKPILCYTELKIKEAK